VLGLQGAEEGLLSTENLDGRTGRLGKVHERSSVGDKARTNKLANKSCQVRGEGLHAVGEVAAEVLAVLSEVYNLLGKSRSRLEVLFCDFGTHGDLCGRLDSRLNLLRQDLGEIALTRVSSETHLEDYTRVGEVVVENCDTDQ
jgi:hypothetical protein